MSPTRKAGLARLAAFTPSMGKAYAARRNEDRGPWRVRMLPSLAYRHGYATGW